jgi:hypothetical protein
MSVLGKVIGTGIIGLAIGVAAKDVAKSTITASNNQYTANIGVSYPSDLPINSSPVYGILFQFNQYSRPSIYNPPNLIPLGSVTLPLSTNMIDITNQNYDTESQGVAGAVLDNINTQESLTTIIGDVASAFAVAAGAAAVGQLGSQAAKYTGFATTAKQALQMKGLALNPFQSVLYNSPVFKTHTLTWTFIPESQTDSDLLHFIVNKFRYHSMPDINDSSTGFFLQYPDIVKPTIVVGNGASRSPYMYDFKDCVIQSIQFNPVPGDTPAFFAGTFAPTAVEFTIQLLEIEYWLKRQMIESQWNYGS